MIYASFTRFYAILRDFYTILRDFLPGTNFPVSPCIRILLLINYICATLLSLFQGMHFHNRVWFMGNVERLHSDRSQVNIINFYRFPVPKLKKDLV